MKVVEHLSICQVLPLVLKWIVLEKEGYKNKVFKLSTVKLSSSLKNKVLGLFQMFLEHSNHDTT